MLLCLACGTERRWWDLEPGHPLEAGFTESLPAGAGLTEVTWLLLEVLPKVEKKGEKD